MHLQIGAGHDIRKIKKKRKIRRERRNIGETTLMKIVYEDMGADNRMVFNKGDSLKRSHLRRR